MDQQEIMTFWDKAMLHAETVGVSGFSGLAATIITIYVLFHFELVQNIVFENYNEMREIVGRWREGTLQENDIDAFKAMAIASLPRGFIAGLLLYGYISI